MMIYKNLSVYTLAAAVLLVTIQYSACFTLLSHNNIRRNSLRMTTGSPFTDSSIMEKTAMFLSDESNSAAVVDSAVSVYSKVDKTGFIGFFANFIEQAIDVGHNAMDSIGIHNNYGYSIIVFTLLIKVLTLPLTTTQLESTTKMQKLTPLQQKIQAKYANDEPTKNQLLAQLFQAAQVNPLAGCLPALVQIPIFISLYRALQNLVAENKLDEPFLWIPDLEGPVYSSPPGESLDWIKSAFSGNPALGWSDTIAFFSLPVILYLSQTVSQKVLQPPKDPNKVLTEQEQISQGLVNNLPFIVAFFSLNVPAGLGVYWVINNILTTVVTVLVKQKFKDVQMPPEVEQMMAMIDAPTITGGARSSGSGKSELKASMTSDLDSRPKTEGFGKVTDAVVADADTGSNDSSSSSSSSNSEEDVDDSKDGRRKKKSKVSKKR